MALGPLGSSKDKGEDISSLSKEEKLVLCAKDLIKALPSRKLDEPQPSDSEDDAREKLMAQVRFESSMFSVQKRFGEEVMKEVLGATRGNNDGAAVAPGLAGSSELKELEGKLKVCGI